MRFRALQAESCALLRKKRVAGILLIVSIALLALLSVHLMNGNPFEDFPPLDGGMFYGICKKIQLDHFAIQKNIYYNGYIIAMVYPQLSFFSVAFLSELLHIRIEYAMNLWVVLWEILYAPAVFYACNTYFHHRLKAFVAAILVLSFSYLDESLGAGGGVARLPGLVFCLLACIFTLASFSNKHKKDVLLAVTFATLTAFTHMEFFALYVGSTILFFFL